MQNKGNIRPTYELISVDKAETPAGMEGDNWYRYVLGQGTSKIEGLRSGSLKSVTQHAENYSNELNERIRSGGSTYSTRKKPQVQDKNAKPQET